jgi:hypothetical protein
MTIIASCGKGYKNIFVLLSFTFETNIHQVFINILLLSTNEKLVKYSFIGHIISIIAYVIPA